MTATALQGGFATLAHDSARAFRATLEAMARPGTIQTLAGAEPPAPLSVAAGVLILTLTDGTTPVHLAGEWDCQDVRDWITFQTGAPLVGPAKAGFAVGAWSDLSPLTRFAIGTPDYPDRSATLIVECDALQAEGAQLTGPGIKDSARLSLPDAASVFAANHARFPLGLDFFFTAGDRLAGLPRSTKVEDI